MPRSPIALIIGFGPGISYHFADQLIKNGYLVAVAARNREKVENLAREIGAHPFVADAGSIESIQSLFSQIDTSLGSPEVVLFNPSARVRGDFTSIDPAVAADAIQVTAVGGFVAAQEAAKRMLPNKKGAIFFTGATASIKGFPKSATFAMGKFAIRGLAQSLAKELGPEGIHVAHFIIDGAVLSEGSEQEFTAKNIAQSYISVLQQPPGAWSWELELRSKDERF
jgi:NAD(P)-dependent dehydrogenase (short-subunit alcohol dehydrogenase family)